MRSVFMVININNKPFGIGRCSYTTSPIPRRMKEILSVSVAILTSSSSSSSSSRNDPQLDGPAIRNRRMDPEAANV